MKRSITFAVLLLATVPAFAQTKAPAVAKELAPFQGTWVLTRPDGQPITPDGELVIVVTGDKYAQSVNGTVNERGTMKLDMTRKPIWVDLLIAEGNDAGKTQLGLIEVKGDTMTGTLGAPGSTVRPTSLTPGPDVIAYVAKKRAK